MNKFLILVVILILINSFFSFIPFLMPRASREIILPYQLWFNTLIVFLIILPNNVGIM
jgi:hypothetical protein